MRPKGIDRSARPTLQLFFHRLSNERRPRTVAVTDNGEPPCHLSHLAAKAEGLRWSASQCRIRLNFCEPRSDVRNHRRPCDCQRRRAAPLEKPATALKAVTGSCLSARSRDNRTHAERHRAAIDSTKKPATMRGRTPTAGIGERMLPLPEILLAARRKSGAGQSTQDGAKKARCPLGSSGQVQEACRDQPA